MSCNCNKPKCDGKCGISPSVLQINNPGDCTLFHRVEVPASMGDSKTNPPKNGDYRNVLLYYVADGTSWLFSSDGIPQKLVSGFTDYEDAINLPQINGETLIGDKSGAELGLQDKLIAGDNIQIAADGKTISATDTTYGPATDDTIGLIKPGNGLSVEEDGTLNIDDPAPEDFFTGESTSCDSGEEVVLKNTLGSLAVLNKIEGNSAQAQITGANLYNYKDTEGMSPSARWEVGEDGWLTCTTYSDHSSRIDANYYTHNLNLQNSTQYAVVLEVKSVAGDGQLAVYSRWTGNSEGQFTTEQVINFSELRPGGIYVYKPTTYATFNYDLGLRTYCRFDADVKGSITCRISVLADTTVTQSTFRYEPFTKGEKAPSPSYPQPVQTVSGDTAIRVYGKNLFDKSSVGIIPTYFTTDHGAAIAEFAISDGVVYMPCSPDTTYTVQKGLQGTTSKNRFRLGTASVKPTYGTPLSDYWSSGDGSTTKVHTITTGASAKYLVIYCYAVDTETTLDEILDTIQVELGSQATEYSPCVYQDYPLDLGGNRLGKIDNAVDKIDYSDGKYVIHKEIGSSTRSIDILGIRSDNEADKSYASAEGAFVMLASDWGDDYATTAGVARMSENIGVYKLDESVTGSAGARAMTDGTFCQRQGTNDRLYFRNTAYVGKTGDEVKAILLANSGGTNLWYPLSTPVDAEVTESPLVNQLNGVRGTVTEHGNIVASIVGAVPANISICSYSNNLPGIIESLRNVSDKTSKSASVIFPLYNMDGEDTLGDCSIIKNGSSVLMIDTFTNQKDCYQGIKDALAQNNIDTIDYLVISHYHGDHIGNVLHLINDGYLDGATVYLPRVAASFPTLNGSDIKTALGLHGVTWVEIDNQVFNVGDGCTVRMLNGSAADYQYYEDIEADSDNNSYNDRSVVCDVDLFGRKLLFTGDLEYRGCAHILPDISSNYDLLKDMHHGLIDNAPDFCAKVNPDYVIIPASAGMVNKNYSDWLINSVYWPRKSKNVAVQGYQSEPIVLDVKESGISAASDIFFVNDLSCRGGTQYYVDYDNADEVRNGSVEHPFKYLNEAMIFLQKDTPNQIRIKVLSLPTTNRSLFIEGFKRISISFDNGLSFDNNITLDNCGNAEIYNLVQTGGTIIAYRSNLYIEGYENSSGGRAIRGIGSAISLRGALTLTVDTEHAIEMSYNSQLSINTYDSINLTFAIGTTKSLLTGYFATMYLSVAAKALLSGYTAAQVLDQNEVSELVLSKTFDDFIAP